MVRKPSWSEELRFVYGTQIFNTNVMSVVFFAVFFLAVAKIFNALSSWAEEEVRVSALHSLNVHSSVPGGSSVKHEQQAQYQL